jgi:general secretion pathway protein N
MPRTTSSNISATTARAPWGWAVAGLTVGALVALCVFAPARWLAGGLAQATQQQVQLQQAQGTVWRGSAQLVLGATTDTAAALPGRVQWDLTPRWHGLRLQLQAPCCLAQAWAWQLGWGLAGLQLAPTDLDKASALRLPSALLASLGTPWNTLALQGTLALQPQGFAVRWQDRKLTLQGRLQLDALGMSTRLTPLNPVGSYRLAFEGGQTPRLTLQTLKGALQLQGQGQWMAGRLQFDGDASAAPGSEDALANLLNIIGRRNGARSIIHVG